MTLSGQPIKYLITGKGSRSINIFDLSDIKAECKFDFDLKNIHDKNKFENSEVDLYLNNKLDLDVFTHHFKYDDLAFLLKIHFSKNPYSSVINNVTDNVEIFKENYEFIKYVNTNMVMPITIFASGSQLLVQLDKDTDLSLFSDLKTIVNDDNRELYINDYLCRSITIDQYKLISYCINSLK